MKILHTSDWHLGRRLEGASLAEPHEHFLNWLIEDFLPVHKPDLMVISGDIFDRPIPPTDAMELYEKSIAKIIKSGTQVLISAGNHDNRVRLGFHSIFMDEMGLHLRTRLRDVDRPLVLENDDFILLSYGIPYLEPDVDAGTDAHQWDVESTPDGVMGEALSRIKRDIADRKSKSVKPIRTLVASHAWVAGGESSDSERNVRIGTLGQASASLFADIDYVAMGHLHGPQRVSYEDAHIFYSGSPIPFSFSEKDHVKRILLVEYTKDGVAAENITSHEISQIRKMQQIRDSVEALMSEKYLATDDWIKVIVTDQEVPLNFYDTLKREKFSHLVQLVPEKSIDGIVDRSGNGVLLQELSHEEVTKRFVKRILRAEELDTQMIETIENCCSEVALTEMELN